MKLHWSRKYTIVSNLNLQLWFTLYFAYRLPYKTSANSSWKVYIYENKVDLENTNNLSNETTDFQIIQLSVYYFWNA